jgi:DNA-binding NarL/FixJ family response regulator
MIRVLIADDHHLVRQGIRTLLEKMNGIEVVGEAATGQEAIDLTEELKPNVVVMDIAMPRMDGAQASEYILAMDIPTEVVILSMHSDTILAQQLLRMGIKGYLLKESIAEELSLAIRSASQGRLYLSPAISDSVMTALMAPGEGDPPESMQEKLTPREREELHLIAEGCTNKAISEALSISVKTVEKHRANVMTKLEVHDLSNLMREAIKHGLIFLE